MTSYSIEISKKFVFVDELNNVVNDSLSDGIYGEETLRIIREYLKKRISEIEKEHG